MNLIEQTKRYLAIDESNSEYDLLIKDCLNYTLSEIENYCRQPLKTTEIEKYYDVVYGKVLMTNFPIQSISEVKIYDSDFYLVATLTAGDYELIKPTSLYFLVLNTNEYHLKKAKVTLSCGYDVLPFDVQKVNIEMSAIMFKESDERGGLKGGRLGLTSVIESINGMSNNTNFKVPIEKWNNILDKYRCPIV